MPSQLTSPHGVLGRRRSSTYNSVRLRSAPPSGLVMLVIWTGIPLLPLTVRANSLEVG